LRMRPSTTIRIESVFSSLLKYDRTSYFFYGKVSLYHLHLALFPQLSGTPSEKTCNQFLAKTHQLRITGADQLGQTVQEKQQERVLEKRVSN